MTKSRRGFTLLQSLIADAVRRVERRPSLIPGRFLADDYIPHEADVTHGALNFRVEWHGQPDDVGRFQVQCGEEWVNCENLDLANPQNDLIFPATNIAIAQLSLVIQRGPDHGHRQFRALAIPIAWRDQCQPDRQQLQDASYVAVRDQDYDHAQPPAQLTWSDSELRSDGDHWLELPLDPSMDYELHIDLVHPTDDSKWMIQDPIIYPRPNSGGSGGTSNN